MLNWKRPKVNIQILKAVLEAVFDECDRFDKDETGGRIIGSYQKKGTSYEIKALGVIPAGPNARRTPTSFFQDGKYQENFFRLIEQHYPEVEHLGNWHTHHVNGLHKLSGGDEATYQRIVNHANHNTDFFYALLVVRRTPDRKRRYEVKHYFLRRGDAAVYEIPDDEVRVVDEPPLLPPGAKEHEMSNIPSNQTDVPANANPERVKDQDFFSEFYPDFRPVFSKTLGALCWKGKLALIDGSQADVAAVERLKNDTPIYSVAMAGQMRLRDGAMAKYKDRSFKTARQAVFHLEKDLNHELYRNKKG